MPHDVFENRPELAKSLGLFRITTYGVGTIIGSGIYAVISPAAAAAGSGIWISFIFAALISALSALSYAELASALPSAGAEHTFLQNALPRFPVAAFLVGLFIAIHGAATLATVALTFGHYINEFWTINPVIVGIILVVGFTMLNISGLKQASWVNVTFTVIQVSCLIALTIAGFTYSEFSNNVERAMAQPIVWDGVFGATAIIFFIYTGYEHMASMSEEAKDPGKNLWRAFLLALGITTVVYLSIIFAVLGLIDPKVLAEIPAPLAAVGRIRTNALGFVITIAALLATANAVLSASLLSDFILKRHPISWKCTTGAAAT